MGKLNDRHRKKLEILEFEWQPSIAYLRRGGERSESLKKRKLDQRDENHVIVEAGRKREKRG